MEPADAVRAWISRPVVTPATTRTDSAGSVARTYTGGSAHEAKLDTLRVVRQKREGSRALLAVEDEDERGHSMSYVYGAREEENGTWIVSGAAGGSSDGEPRRPEPWANLGGWGNKRFLCAGGRVKWGPSVPGPPGWDGRSVD